MKKRIFIAVIAILVFFINFGGKPGRNPRSVKAVSISFSGAYSLYPLTQLWAAEYNKTHHDVRFDIQSGGAGKGLTDCITGAVDVGMFSRELTPGEKAQVWSLWLCKDAILPTVNSHNPNINSLRIRGLKKADFQGIFVDRNPATWEELLGVSSKTPHKINVYTRSDASGAAGTWASYFGKAQENLKGIGVNGDPGLADAVKKDINGIGFNSYPFIYDLKTGKKFPNIEVIPIDVNGNGTIDADENFYDNIRIFEKAVNDGKYPSPPVRNLYFLVKAGKAAPKEVLDFFQWVLTEGQKYLAQAGYVPLPKGDLAGSLKKLATARGK
ncbi:MAG TPA: PstS family phosphate ABC transporter substrate-binding protein [Chitinophagaceae bacterium]|nr:PstS family phosphate ABC transporter substrate-binding protein [Chitinophagaceae bacterium]